MASRKVQEINAGSMADIAFLLLIFFLVATTMNVDSGIQRVLPPMPDETQPQQAMDVKKRNILLVFVSKFDDIMVGGERMDITQLKDKVKEFVLNPADDPNLPEKEVTKIDLIGNFPVSKGVVSLQNDRGTSYNRYIMVQNELTRAFNEIRDMVAAQYFGGKKFLDLEEAQRTAVQKAVPLKISEAEPRNIEGGK
ncbi:ExbD/TolR family protein [Gallalistipes aquisgranensis]|uniref:ExbD/TolR family protein n=1 Tax=Gallalistipes aquisgranensis TaxID=2779358 RepID=UPI001CF89513|nr:biopolymer transporter ExbD [Gallalistipes aquisgranensis]MBE5034546.1 biopolymer transporter ExbD [Gallalistipes aquisgranensis]